MVHSLHLLSVSKDYREIHGRTSSPCTCTRPCKHCLLHTARQACLARISFHVLLACLCTPWSSQCFSAFRSTLLQASVCNQRPMVRQYTCFRCRFCCAQTAGQECLARSAVIDVVCDCGQLVQPLYISSQCRFCRTHDAGQECLACSSAYVLLTCLRKPRSSQCFSAFFPRCFRPHSASAIRGNYLVRPLSISFPCHFCRARKAGQKCLARSSVDVLLPYRF